MELGSWEGSLPAPEPQHVRAAGDLLEALPRSNQSGIQGGSKGGRSACGGASATPIARCSQLAIVVSDLQVVANLKLFLNRITLPVQSDRL